MTTAPSYPLEVQVRGGGLLTTIQDLGRYGYAHLGFSPCGAADRVAARIANQLVGNPEEAPLLEVTLLGPTLQFSERAVVAITGSFIDCSLDGQSIPTWQSIEVQAGSALRLGATVQNARSYVAIAGRLRSEPVLGSFSTDLGAGVGPLGGRALLPGDVLSWDAMTPGASRRADQQTLALLYNRGPLRVTPGPHLDHFSALARGHFLSKRFVVTHQSNRSGLRLHGEPLPGEHQTQLLTEGVPLGAVQVPGDGLPVILFVDQQTTGGYPVIASVISADLHRVAQMLPNHEAWFEELTFGNAIQELRRREDLLSKVVVQGRAPFSAAAGNP